VLTGTTEVLICEGLLRLTLFEVCVAGEVVVSAGFAEVGKYPPSSLLQAVNANTTARMGIMLCFIETNKINLLLSKTFKREVSRRFSFCFIRYLYP